MAAIAYLMALRGAGVDLKSSGRRFATEDGPLDCFDAGRSEPEFHCVVSPEPASEPATFERPEFLEPPSRRSRSRPVPRPTGTTVAAAGIVDVLIRYPYFHLEGVALGSAERALLVTSHEDGPREGAVLCVARAGWLRCETTAVERLTGVVAEHEGTWLLTGSSSFGNHRSGEGLLVSLSIEGDTLTHDLMGIGSMYGHGEACRAHPGYCVLCESALVSASLVAEGCIERRHEGGWSATHVRRGDLWLDEVITPREGGPCIDSFSFGAGGFERSECGPPSPTPFCPSEEPLVREPFQ